MHKIKNILVLSLFVTFSVVGLFISNVGRVSAGAKEDCEATGGEWVVSQESVAGTVIDASFCRCPSGTLNLPGGCQTGAQYDCEATGGEWVVSQESVAGTVIDASFCDCPDGTLNLPGGCTPEEVQEQNSVSSGTASVDCDQETLTRDNCGIVNYVVILINFLSAVAIMAIIASMMFAGYQYMTARDNPGAVSAAKQRIVWAFVALGVFIFGYALLNFLVPGGIL